MNKRCSKCRLELDIKLFHRSKDKKSGYSSQCKNCKKDTIISFNLRNPNKLKEYRRKWREENREHIRLHYHKNRDKIGLQRREKYKRDPLVRAKQKDLRMRGTYGLTLEDYEKLVVKQNGLCLICRLLPNNNLKSTKLYVDHSHKTGEVRGLLCHRCNNGLGCFNDNKELLEEAIKYLNSYEIKQTPPT